MNLINKIPSEDVDLPQGPIVQGKLFCPFCESTDGLGKCICSGNGCEKGYCPERTRQDENIDPCGYTKLVNPNE